MVVGGALHVDAAKARRLLREILASGILTFSGHAKNEMAKDNLTEVDVRNTLKGGRPQAGEFENRSWRYGILTSKIGVVIAFRAETWAVVVTAWRIGK